MKGSRVYILLYIIIRVVYRVSAKYIETIDKNTDDLMLVPDSEKQEVSGAIAPKWYITEPSETEVKTVLELTDDSIQETEKASSKDPNVVIGKDYGVPQVLLPNVFSSPDLDNNQEMNGESFIEQIVTNLGNIKPDHNSIAPDEIVGPEKEEIIDIFEQELASELEDQIIPLVVSQGFQFQDPEKLIQPDIGGPVHDEETEIESKLSALDVEAETRNLLKTVSLEELLGTDIKNLGTFKSNLTEAKEWDQDVIKVLDQLDEEKYDKHIDVKGKQANEQRESLLSKMYEFEAKNKSGPISSILDTSFNQNASLKVTVTSHATHDITINTTSSVGPIKEDKVIYSSFKTSLSTIHSTPLNSTELFMERIRKNPSLLFQDDEVDKLVVKISGASALLQNYGKAAIFGAVLVIFWSTLLI